MRQLLIVSPNFPPVSAPDMHRVRMSLPYYAQHGWSPAVLAVAGDDGRVLEPALAGLLPSTVPIERVGALPLGLTRMAGVGNVGLRAFGHLYRAGLRLIRSRSIDLVFFSTTMFPAMALGRLWKARTGVPFVLDMQDPWINDYLDAHAGARPKKYAWARLLHGRLEPFTMRAVGGVMAVSPAYHETLRRRYPWIDAGVCATIPFGAAEEDLEGARRLDWRNPWFTPGDGRVHAVYLGRGGRDLETAATIFFRAVARLRRAGAARNLRVWCVGTDYAPAGQGQATLEPVARREGLGDITVESPDRIPFLDAMRILQDADLLVVLGSGDRHYSPSKVYPYLLARRPLVSILHRDSPAVDLVRRAAAGPVVTFAPEADVDAAATELAGAWPRSLGERPALPRELVEPWLAPELTRRQCALFDAVLARAGRDT
jgi:hypothetical protein